jgi:hypothetical protein
MVRFIARAIYALLMLPCRATRVPFVDTNVAPPAKGAEHSGMLPEASAGWFSVLTWNWVTHLLAVGYARPLVASDLYELPPHRSAELIADKILASYDRRTAAADAYNAKLARGEVGPGWRRAWWALRGGAKERELKWREGSGRRKPSLTLACNDAIFRWFWIGGFLKFLSDMAQTTSPLVLKVGPAH